MKNQLTSTAAATSVTGNATATAQAAQALMKYSGISSASSNKVGYFPYLVVSSAYTDIIQEGEYVPTEEDGKLKVEVAQKMLKWHAESIGRCVELSVAGDLPKNVFALMRTLSEAIGRGYVETALES